jgi:PBP1b-binding outer membrane lipoprotein LpoB
MSNKKVIAGMLVILALIFTGCSTEIQNENNLMPMIINCQRSRSLHREYTEAHKEAIL